MWIEKHSCRAAHQMVSRCCTRDEYEGSITYRQVQVGDWSWLWNLDQTSHVAQNRGISGPLKRTYILKNNFKKIWLHWHLFFCIMIYKKPRVEIKVTYYCCRDKILSKYGHLCCCMSYVNLPVAPNQNYKKDWCDLNGCQIIYYSWKPLNIYFQWQFDTESP